MMDTQLLTAYLRFGTKHPGVFDTKTGYGVAHASFRLYLQQLPDKGADCQELRISRLTADEQKMEPVKTLIERLILLCREQKYTLSVYTGSTDQSPFWQERGFVSNQTGVLTYSP
jgi:hypothetical protein